MPALLYALLLVGGRAAAPGVVLGGLRLPRQRAELAQEEGLEAKELARYARRREDLGAPLPFFFLGEWMRMIGEARVCLEPGRTSARCAPRTPQVGPEGTAGTGAWPRRARRGWARSPSARVRMVEELVHTLPDRRQDCRVVQCQGQEEAVELREAPHVHHRRVHLSRRDRHHHLVHHRVQFRHQRPELPDAVIVVVRDEDLARPVHRHARRALQLPNATALPNCAVASHPRHARASPFASKTWMR